MMFQSYALFPHMTVEKNVAYGLLREGMPRPRPMRASPRC
jgi:putrescine transport system ATP-binding protein